MFSLSSSHSLYLISPSRNILNLSSSSFKLGYHEELYLEVVSHLLILFALEKIRNACFLRLMRFLPGLDMKSTCSPFQLFSSFIWITLIFLSMGVSIMDFFLCKALTHVWELRWRNGDKWVIVLANHFGGLNGDRVSFVFCDYFCFSFYFWLFRVI